MLTYENHNANGIYVSDENGEHTFASEEEYQAYKKEKYDKLPIICDNCIYHLQENKKKFKCPFDRNPESVEKYGQSEGHCKGCTYYWTNPETTRDWYKWYKQGFLSRYYYYKNKFERKFKLGFYLSYRKFFFYWPTRKYPYFEFVHRTRNEYENECNIWHIGWISKEKSYRKKKSTFFEKFYWSQYHFPTEHINYEYALCTDDFYVETFNNINSQDSYFKCHKDELYKVRPIRKYHYYDILYNKRDADEYELQLKGQITEEDFNKHFRIPEHEEVLKKLEERAEKRKQQTNKE